MYFEYKRLLVELQAALLVEFNTTLAKWQSALARTLITMLISFVSVTRHSKQCQSPTNHGFPLPGINTANVRLSQFTLICRGDVVWVLTLKHFDFSFYELIILYNLNMYFKPKLCFDIKYLFISSWFKPNMLIFGAGMWLWNRPREADSKHPTAATL